MCYAAYTKGTTALLGAILSAAEGLGVRTELEQQWDAVREKLFLYREKRIHPLKDDKILTNWNGLMIGAFALGARILDDSKYAEFKWLFLLSQRQISDE